MTEDVVQLCVGPARMNSSIHRLSVTATCPHALRQRILGDGSAKGRGAQGEQREQESLSIGLHDRRCVSVSRLGRKHAFAQGMHVKGGSNRLKEPHSIVGAAELHDIMAAFKCS